MAFTERYGDGSQDDLGSEWDEGTSKALRDAGFKSRPPPPRPPSSGRG